MDIIKKLFSFNDDESCAIGLCKFSDEFYKYVDSKETMKNRMSKDQSLSQMLKRQV